METPETVNMYGSGEPTEVPPTIVSTPSASGDERGNRYQHPCHDFAEYRAAYASSCPATAALGV